MPPAEEADGLTIAQMDGRYSSLRPENKKLTRLHVIDRSGHVRTFQYAHLDAESTFDGNTFTLVFAGTRRWRVTVTGHGPLFWAAYGLLHPAPLAVPSPRGDPRGLRQPGRTVFTRIVITAGSPLAGVDLPGTSADVMPRLPFTHG